MTKKCDLCQQPTPDADKCEICGGNFREEGIVDLVNVLGNKNKKDNPKEYTFKTHRNKPYGLCDLCGKPHDGRCDT